MGGHAGAAERGGAVPGVVALSFDFQVAYCLFFFFERASVAYVLIIGADMPRLLRHRLSLYVYRQRERDLYIYIYRERERESRR